MKRRFYVSEYKDFGMDTDLKTVYKVVDKSDKSNPYMCEARTRQDARNIVKALSKAAKALSRDENLPPKIPRSCKTCFCSSYCFYDRGDDCCKYMISEYFNK
jgi:hypothetical protein